MPRKARRIGPIYVSPDGGETVDEEQAYEEAEMVGAEAIALRRKYPTLQKAWDKYLTVWHLINGNE